MSKNALNQRKRFHRKPAPVEKARVQAVQEPRVSQEKTAVLSLTDEQVDNWRKVLATTIGPYALICSREEVEKLRDMMQEYASTVAEKLSP